MSRSGQHLQAVLDLPLGSTSPLALWAVMVNLLGSEFKDPRDAYPEMMALHSSAKIHMCDKEVKPGCRLDHVTVCDNGLDAARVQTYETVEALVGHGASAGSPTARD